MDIWTPTSLPGRCNEHQLVQEKIMETVTFNWTTSQVVVGPSEMVD